ncbi:MAG: hypothetical protein AAB588_00060 [Patescibacteria group bacterium]
MDPAPLSPAPSESKSLKFGIFVILAVLLGGSFAAGAVYLWQQSEQEKMSTTLQSQVASLKQQVLTLQQNATAKQEEKDEPEAGNTDTSETSKPTINQKWKLVSGDVEDTCSKPTFAGEATVRGWYVWEAAYVEGTETWMLKVIAEDVKELPLQNLVSTYPEFNKTLRVVDVPADLEAKLKKASEKNPVAVTLKGYSAYCEGAPIASLKGLGAFKQ